ncbi:hypothetical protein QEV83_17690 [Methylocapsa sp. D3K7]|uniref:hypothetical protein n=1 Tax=Methylocapsa sp. D3K7 TaxID=3041435 RepID=UPI00244E8453|nr:hypothetical protein [Methylocapsa sp. D3K7]WGJ14441.1 hypothetical protein QEV83_17690 [Methylocapsa sp. D3K7]
MDLRIGGRVKWALAGRSLAALLAYDVLNPSAYAAAQDTNLNLVCSGNSYKKDGPFPTPETFTLKIDGKKPVFIGGPGSEKPVKARTIASNEIQLKFATGKFTGEYFNFTGDLFLIHNDGRLTRLMCKPS